MIDIALVRELKPGPFPAAECTVDKTEDPKSKVFESPYPYLVLVQSNRFDTLHICEAHPFICETEYLEEGEEPGPFYAWWTGDRQIPDLERPIVDWDSDRVVAWVKLPR